VVAGDITDPQLRAAVLAEAQRHWGGLDLLINNAGVGAVGPFAAASEDRLRRVLEVNFFAPAELTRAALPLLRAGRRPMIVNVGSVLGHRAVPGKSEYCASKFALHGWSDAVRAELAQEGIDVLLVSPSTTESEFFERVLEGDAGRATPTGRAMQADRVARLTIRAMRAGRHEIILSPGGKLLVWLDRLAPPLVNRLVAWWG
jgi:short-subunit dehydrogenase